MTHDRALQLLFTRQECCSDLIVTLAVLAVTFAVMALIGLIPGRTQR
jgi:hypothetical protein